MKPVSFREDLDPELGEFSDEMPELHVVAAGSLLEFTLKDAAFPVGRIQILNLYPLCFAEYLEAIGNAPAAVVVLCNPADITPAVHELLRDDPVEVKSGAAGSLKSLHLFMVAYPDCGQAMVFSDRPYADLPEQRITFMPLYSAFAATGGRKKLDDVAR